MNIWQFIEAHPYYALLGCLFIVFMVGDICRAIRKGK